MTSFITSMEHSLDSWDLPSILVLLGIIMVILFIVLKWTRRKQPRSILLLGCSNSGKTVLFTNLIHNKTVITYMSMKENIGLYKSKRGNVQLVDIPGHERLRQSLIDQYKADTRAIVFVIDSKTIQSEIRDVAEVLYSLFTDSVVTANSRKILIVCNKQDLPEAKGPTVIQLLLERELSILKKLKVRVLDSTSDDSERRSIHLLGNRDRDFEFSQLKSNVTFVEAIVSPETGSETNVEEIVDWLSVL